MKYTAKLFVGDDNPPQANPSDLVVSTPANGKMRAGTIIDALMNEVPQASHAMNHEEREADISAVLEAIEEMRNGLKPKFAEKKNPFDLPPPVEEDEDPTHYFHAVIERHPSSPYFKYSQQMHQRAELAHQKERQRAAEQWEREYEMKKQMPGYSRYSKPAEVEAWMHANGFPDYKMYGKR